MIKHAEKFFFNYFITAEDTENEEIINTLNWLTDQLIIAGDRDTINNVIERIRYVLTGYEHDLEKYMAGFAIQTLLLETR